MTAFFKRRTQGFTLVELLAVMAIIGILSGMVAGAVTGLGTAGINDQIISDTKVIETAADRFLNASFPATYPVESLPEGEKEGVGTLTHTIKIDPAHGEVPGTLTLEMDRTGIIKAHNEATDNWDLKIFATNESSGDIIVINPPVSAVYRWFTGAHSTTLVEDIFRQVLGKQTVIIKPE